LLTRLDAAPRVASEIAAGKMVRTQAEVRRSQTVKLDDRTHLRLKHRVETLRETLQVRFREPLDECQRPTLLRYDVGDFFTLHCDNPPYDSGHPDLVRERRIAVVVFLNDDFAGGDLRLYCLESKPTWDNFVFNLRPRAGMAVAFRASVFHEVTPVRSGVRYSLATWFKSAAGAAAPPD
jgi:SM-20-related protein